MTETKFKKKLNNLIVESSLKNEEKMLWEIFMKISNSDEEEAVYEAASEANENLMLLTSHLRDKILHMKESNKKAWDILIKDEERYAFILD